MRPDGLFITGTDTGVGKTVVGAAIALHWRDCGRRVAAFKPVETGIGEVPGALADSDLLLRASDLSARDEVCLYQLEAPLAPAVAADMEGIHIDVPHIVRHCQRLRERHDAIIVEGAGGVMVPLRWDYLYLDLMAELALPTVVVARAGLGTLNHTLLTFSALERRGIEVYGIILNRRASRAEVAERTNPDAIRRLSGCDRILVLPEVSGADEWSHALELKPYLQEWC